MRQFEAGEIVAGRYRLQHPLAKGGMGSVWTAWNQQLEVPVAIKFMAPEALGSAELIARFEREAKAAAQMRIPQVVQIFETGLFQDVPFMVMELLEGEDLGKRLRTRGRLSIAETARIVNEVCKALRRAHELKIVHRDLKPANVFIAQNGDEEVIKVLDFGIAKVLGSGSGSAVDATKTGALIGTPNYMSPEQAHRRNRQVDHRSDLWSLGVIAFRAITGKLPFAGGDPVEVLMRIVTQPAPAASSMAPDVSPAVDRFFARALASDPDMRFQTARDFAEAMSALAVGPVPHPLGQSWSGEPPLAASPPAQPRRDGVPPPRASRPGEGAPPAGPRSALPRDALGWQGGPGPAPTPGDARGVSAPEALDPLDSAATVPIQRSAAGQAYLAAVPQPGSAYSGAPASGLSRQPSSPHGIAPPSPQQPPAAPVGPAAASAPSSSSPSPGSPRGPSTQPGPGGAWQGSTDAGGKKFIATLPLGMPASAVLPPARPALGSIPDQQGDPGGAAPAAAMTSAGESPSTITSATGELPVRRPRRTSYVVWAAGAAALLVIAVVGSVVVASVTAQPDPEPIPLPPTVAPILTVGPPSTGVTPSPSVTPAPTPGTVSSSSAPASASAAPSAAPTTKPSTTPATGTAKPRATAAPRPQSTGNSAIFGQPVFSP